MHPDALYTCFSVDSGVYGMDKPLHILPIAQQQKLLPGAVLLQKTYQ